MKKNHRVFFNLSFYFGGGQIKEAPQDIDVYLIAVENTKFNVGLTEAVKEGGDKMVDLLIQEVRSTKHEKIV
jgi:Ni,Fe-hydrogenase maturation factor